MLFRKAGRLNERYTGNARNHRSVTNGCFDHSRRAIRLTSSGSYRSSSGTSLSSRPVARCSALGLPGKGRKEYSWRPAELRPYPRIFDPWRLVWGSGERGFFTVFTAVAAFSLSAFISPFASAAANAARHSSLAFSSSAFRVWRRVLTRVLDGGWFRGVLRGLTFLDVLHEKNLVKSHSTRERGF